MGILFVLLAAAETHAYMLPLIRKGVGAILAMRAIAKTLPYPHTGDERGDGRDDARAKVVHAEHLVIGGPVVQPIGRATLMGERRTLMHHHPLMERQRGRHQRHRRSGIAPVRLWHGGCLSMRGGRGMFQRRKIASAIRCVPRPSINPAAA